MQSTPAPPLVSSRIFPVDRHALFSALTDAETLARWWGPAGFRNAFDRFEPRGGGAWHFRMYGPDGAEYQMVKRFEEVTPPSRIVLRHLEPPSHAFTMEMDLAEAEGGTRLTWTMRFDDPAELEGIRQVLVDANEQNFDRLAAELAADARSGEVES